MEKQSMTMEAMGNFAKAVQSDETMARGLAGAIGQKQGGAAAEAFAAYAQEQGFAVTLDDAVELQMAAHARAEGTLSEDELEAFAGGFLSASPSGTFKNFAKMGIHILR